MLIRASRSGATCLRSEAASAERPALRLFLSKLLPLRASSLILCQFFAARRQKQAMKKQQHPTTTAAVTR